MVKLHISMYQCLPSITSNERHLRRVSFGEIQSSSFFGPARRTPGFTSHLSATSHWPAILQLQRQTNPQYQILPLVRIPVSAMADFNWRTINIDALDPESAYNFDLSTLTPTIQPTSTQDVQTLNGQIRQLLRGGNAEGALRGGLENVPYGADEQGKVGIPSPSSILEDRSKSGREQLLTLGCLPRPYTRR